VTLLLGESWVFDEIVQGAGDAVSDLNLNHCAFGFSFAVFAPATGFVFANPPKRFAFG
jgi:hypothetical protein